MAINPRLSIGVPVYNGERFLPGLMENLTSQTFRDFEIVISDNASTDRTAEICNDWMRRDERVRYHRNPTNIGASGNFNKVFEICRAPLFKWAACDDSYGPTYLEACVGILDRNRDVVVAQTDVICIDDQGRPFQRDEKDGTFIIPGTTLRYAVDPVDVGESPVAATRFADVLFRCRSNAQIFGVMRREALAATDLLPSFLGSEKATVLELALIGRFQQHREALFYRCYHPGITEVKSNDESRLYISTDRSTYLRPLRMLRTFFGTPLGKPVSLATKAACFGLLVWRGATFVGRSIFQSEARNWPFKAAWGEKDRHKSNPT